MTTQVINPGDVRIPQGSQELTSSKAKGDREGQSFMDVLSIADRSASAGQTKTEAVKPKDVQKQVKKTEGAKPDEKPVDAGKDPGRGDKGKVDETGKTGKTGKTDAPADTEKTGTQTKIEKAAEDVKSEIEEKLSISEEDLDLILETLGITTADLFDTRIVVDVVAAAEDVTPVDMVSNEDLTDLIQTLQSDVREISADLMQDLDMDPAEFRKALAELTTEEVIPLTPEKEEGDATAPQMIEGEQREDRVPEDIAVRTPAEAVRPLKDTGERSDRTERISVDEDTGRGEVNLSAGDRTVGPVNQQGSEDSSSQGDLFRSESRTGSEVREARHTADRTDHNIFFQNLTQAVDNTLEAVQADALPGRSSMVDAMDLINQISSQIRAVVESETQSLSMQLHPQSLGRVNVEVVSKAGQITAQFEAENASVRAALEGHIAELKQTLEQRGLRVESVEVTVASHQFEQNLMGGNQSEGTYEEEGRRPRTRRINLGDIAEGDEEDLDEETRIAKDMMEANGNSVDFMA